MAKQWLSLAWKVQQLEKKVEELSKENEILLWNLAGCDIFANGNELDISSPEGDKVRPALKAVYELARKFYHPIQKGEELKAEVERLNQAYDSALIGWSNDRKAMNDEVEKAEVERDRYKAALEDIYRNHYKETGWGVAKKALQGDA